MSADAHPNREAIAALARGDSVPTDADDIITHLGGCEACQRIYEGAANDAPAELPAVPGYQMVRELGRGGMGIVWEAVGPDGTPVAVKVLASRQAADPQRVELFRREARIAARLTELGGHENVVGYRATGSTSDGSPFLAMDLLTADHLGGTDLRMLVGRRPLDVGEAVRYVRQAARGLHFLHSNRLVHRDVKPSNLIVTSDGVVKLVDLGIARDEAGGGTLTRAAVVPGTPAYMAPEQARRQRTDARTDVYGLGCTLYFLLSGRPPFEGTDVDVIAGHLNSRPAPLPSRIPRRLTRVIDRMMAKEPADRYPTAEEAAEALAPFDPSSGFVRVRSRPRWPWAAGVAVVAITMAVVSVMIGPRRTPPADTINLLPLAPQAKVPTTSLALPATPQPPVAPPPAPAKVSRLPDRFKPVLTYPTAANWKIDENEVVQTGKDCPALLLFGDPAWRDITFSCEILRQSGSSTDLVFRASNRNAYYYFEPGGWDNTWHDVQYTTSPNGSGEEWRRVINGRVNDPVNLKEWVPMAVELRGNRIVCSRNGRVVLRGVDDARESGLVGLRTWNTTARFRNIRVTDAAGQVMMEGVPDLVPLKTR